MNRISFRAPRSRRQDRRDRSRWIGSVEPLEGRALLSTFTWNSSADGNFNNPAMWTGPNNIHAVPGPGDDAFAPSGNYTISVTGSATVNSFTGGAALRVNAGTFTVTGAGNATASTVNNLSVAAGAAFHSGRNTTLNGSGLISGNLDVAAGGTVTLSGSSNAINLEAGATLTGAGTYDILSNLNLDATVTAPVNLILDSGNSSGISGVGKLSVPSGATFDWRSGSMTGLGGETDILSGATFKIDGNSNKSITDRALVDAGTTTLANSGTLTIDGVAAFTNSGTFTIQDDQLVVGQGTFVNAGTLTKTSNSPSGKTDFSVRFNNNGTAVAMSGVLQLDNGGASTGTFNSPTPGGTLKITGRGYSLNPGTTFTGAGTVHLSPGFLGTTTVNLNTSLSIPNLAIDDGSVSGPGSLTVPGTLSIDNGTLSIAGLTIPSGATLRLAGSHVAVLDSGTFNNAGTVTISGGEAFQLTGAATFTNSGAFNIQNDTTGGVGNLSFASTSSFVNAPTGVITKSSPAGSGTTNIGDGSFTNHGTIHVASGQLLLDDVGTNTGALVVDANAALALTRSWTLNPGTTLTGAGALTIGDGFFGYGTIFVNTSLSAANFLLPGGNLNLAPSTTLTANRLTLLGGTISGLGTVAVPSGGTLDISGGAARNIDQATLSNAGLATWSGTGSINLSNGATIYNQAGGIFNVTNDQPIYGGSGGIFNNAGAVNKTSVGVGTSAINVNVNNLLGGVITVFSGNLATGSLANLGIVSLGGPTTLSVSGNYTQPFSGTLIVAIAGAPSTDYFGQLRVSGQASLNGTLRVNLAPNFTPALGQSTPILTYGSSVGTFGTTVEPTAGGLPVFSTSQRAAEFDLVAAKPAAPTGLTLVRAYQAGSPNVSSSATPLLIGMAEPNASVQVLSFANNAFTLVAVGTAGPDGVFRASTLAPLTAGNYTLVAVAIDARGYGPNGLPFAMTVLARPSAPTGLSVAPASQSGGPNSTRSATPLFTGTAEPGAGIQVFSVVNNVLTLVAVANVGADGTFTATTIRPFTPGTYSLVAVAIDARGYGVNGLPFALTVLS